MRMMLLCLSLALATPLAVMATTVCPKTLPLGPDMPTFTLVTVAVSHGDPRDAQAYALLKPDEESLDHNEVRYQWLGLSPPSWPEYTPEAYRQVYVTCHYDHGLRLTRHLTPTPQRCAYQQRIEATHTSSDLNCD